MGEEQTDVLWLSGQEVVIEAEQLIAALDRGAGERSASLGLRAAAWAAARLLRHFVELERLEWKADEGRRLEPGEPPAPGADAKSKSGAHRHKWAEVSGQTVCEIPGCTAKPRPRKPAAAPAGGS